MVENLRLKKDLMLLGAELNENLRKS